MSLIGPAPWTVRGLIARPVDLKRRFGEFALRTPVGPNWVTPDPAWVRRNIRKTRVPILGTVTCDRRMIPVLRHAMADLARRGLARLVDPGDDAGCYAPRRIPSSGTLSLHAWGLAVDLNASRNPQGAPPHQDLRLVPVMERHGFSWGGRGRPSRTACTSSSTATARRPPTSRCSGLRRCGRRGAPWPRRPARRRPWRDW